MGHYILAAYATYSPPISPRRPVDLSSSWIIALYYLGIGQKKDEACKDDEACATDAKAGKGKAARSK